MELYNYEFSVFSNDDISEYGYYGYGHIDDYWNEEGRFPYLIRVDGKIAGFALICPHCNYRKEENARSIGEFFVMLKYRRRGSGLKLLPNCSTGIRGLGKFVIGKTTFRQAGFGKKSSGNTQAAITRFAERSTMYGWDLLLGSKAQGIRK